MVRATFCFVYFQCISCQILLVFKRCCLCIKSRSAFCTPLAYYLRFLLSANRTSTQLLIFLRESTSTSSLWMANGNLGRTRSQWITYKSLFYFIFKAAFLNSWKSVPCYSKSGEVSDWCCFLIGMPSCAAFFGEFPSFTRVAWLYLLKRIP